MNVREIFENSKEYINLDESTHYFGQIEISFENETKNYFGKYIEGDFKYFGSIHK